MLLSSSRACSGGLVPQAQAQGRTRGPFHPCKRRASSSACWASTSGGSESGAVGAKSWGAVTSRLVGLSSIPFSVLVLPQVIQNFSNLSSGNAAALAVISWQGYAAALMGNTLMCSHFAHRNERSAVNVQLIGIASNMMVLLQVMLGGFIPTALFACVAGTVAVAVAVNLARVTGRLPPPPKEGLGVWRSWLLLAGVVGLSIVPQVLYATVCPGSQDLRPGATALLLLTALLVGKFRASGAQEAYALVEQLPGWASTLLFALSPVPQLVRNFVDPSGLEGLSVGTMLLALAGNALMVPRALFTRDVVWLTGSTWALAVAGWGQLLSMFLQRSPATGLRYVSAPAFAAITAAMLAFLAVVWTRDAQAQRELRGAAGSPQPT